MSNQRSDADIRRTVVKSNQGVGVFSKNAFLTLDCGHITIVPIEDEESYSFVGAETNCEGCK